MVEDFESLVLAFEAANTGLWEVLITPEEELTQRVRRSVNEIRRFREHYRNEIGSTRIFSGKESVCGESKSAGSKSAETESAGSGGAGSDGVEGAPLLSTGVAAVDTLLGGGLLRRAVTEISGPAAAGKTCLCCQIAVEHGAAAVYFTFEESVAALCRRMKDIVDVRGLPVPACRFAAVKTLAELRCGLAALRRAPAAAPRPAVIIIDSIAAALHANPNDVPGPAAAAAANWLVSMQRLALKRTAFELNAAVVITNHVRDAERIPKDLPSYYASVQQMLVEGDCAPPHRELRQRPMNGFRLADFISARLILARSTGALAAGREARLVFSRIAAPARVALEMHAGGLEGSSAPEDVRDAGDDTVKSFEPLTPALESTPI